LLGRELTRSRVAAGGIGGARVHRVDAPGAVRGDHHPTRMTFLRRGSALESTPRLSGAGPVNGPADGPCHRPRRPPRRSARGCRRRWPSRRPASATAAGFGRAGGQRERRAHQDGRDRGGTELGRSSGYFGLTIVFRRGAIVRHRSGGPSPVATEAQARGRRVREQKGSSGLPLRHDRVPRESVAAPRCGCVQRSGGASTSPEWGDPRRPARAYACRRSL